MPQLIVCPRFCSLVVALLLGQSLLQAQVLQPVTWAFTVEQAGGKTYLVHTATIKDGWTVYSQYLDSEDGPVATEITYEELAGAKLVGKGVEGGGKVSGYDDIFRMNVTKFKHDYKIRQEVQQLGDKPVKGYLTFMVCDKTQCLPPTDVDFSFSALGIKSAGGTTGELASAKDTKSAAGQGTAAGAKRTPSGKTAPPPPTSRAKDDDRQTISAATPNLAAPGVGSGEGNDGINMSANDAAKGQEGPVRWSFAVRRIDDTTYVLSAQADIEQDWNIYAQDVEEGGPIPTSFHFEPDASYVLDGKVRETGTRKAGLDPVFKVQVAKLLAPRAVFEQRVIVREPGAVVAGYLEFMSCDQTQCMAPQDIKFVFVPDQLIAKLGSRESLTQAPVAAGGDPISAYRIDKRGEGATCGDDITASVSVGAKDSLLKIFFLGFGGGLLALLTPCVFPMIPLTVSFFTGRGKDRKRGVRRALIYGLSIIVIYVGLGLLVTSIFGADALNSFSTNPWVNIAFGVLFIVFAMSFFGLFEITLPSSWANTTDRAADQGGLLGIFFMAFTLSLVSFSCTGPIIGTLLVETVSGGGRTLFGHVPVPPLLGMLGFSTALALPFTLFAAFPSALQSLPKSGGWMDAVKVTLGIVEIAFAMKFLSTADLILGTKWMPYELFLGVWVLCAAVLALYYFGVLSRRVGAKADGRSLVNLGLGLGALGIAIYFALGFRYDEQTQAFDTPSVASGLAPPAGHSYIYPKDCPRDFDCFKDYEEGLAYARSVGKPILLDFTGHGCVNCRKMEDQVWGQPGVHERIKQDYVLVSLYVDERTELSEPFVSDYSGRKLRTVGNKWADFQARNFSHQTQPFYVLLSPDEEVLTQPVPYTPDVQEYAAFLACGLNQFEQLKKGVNGSLGSR